MDLKTYKVGYSSQGTDIPCIKITGKWLVENGFSVGERLNLVVDDGILFLTKLTEDEFKKLEDTKHIKKIKN